MVHASREVVSASGTSPGLVAACGILPGWDDGARWSQAGLSVEVTDSSHAAMLRQLRDATLIATTADQCGEVWGRSMFSGFALVWLAEPSSLRDALWFWNARALMDRTFTPARALLVTPENARHPKFAGGLIEHFGGPRKWTTPDIFMTSLTFDRAIQDDLVSEIGFSVVPRDAKISAHIGRARKSDDEVTVATAIDPFYYLLAERGPGRSTVGTMLVTRPKSILRMQSPVTFAGPIGGHVRVRVARPDFLNVPRRQPVASLLIANSEWRFGGLEIESNPRSEYHLEPSIPPRSEIFEAALSAVGITFELSQPGRLAQAVSTANASDLFLNLAMHRVVGALTTPRSKNLVRELNSQLTPGLPADVIAAIADALGPRLDQVVKSAQEVTGKAGRKLSEVARCLEQLVASSLADRGLKVVCAQCGLTSFVPLVTTQRAPVCPACGAPAIYTTNPKGELLVHYRLNPLLDRASDHGVLPHLFVRAALPAPQSHSLLHFGANISRDGHEIGEADILGYIGTSVVCGEVKTSSAGFTANELRRSVRLSDEVQADEIILGCVETIEQDVLTEAHALLAGRRRIRVVDPDGVRIAQPVEE